MKKCLVLILSIVFTSAMWALTYSQTETITNSASNQGITFNLYNGGYTLQSVTVEVHFYRSGGSIGATNSHTVDSAQVTLELGAEYNLKDGGVAPRLLDANVVDIWENSLSEFFYSTLGPLESVSHNGNSYQGTKSGDIHASYISGYVGAGTFNWTLEKDAINNVSSTGGSVNGQFTALDIGGYIRIIYVDDQPLPVELSTFTAAFVNNSLFIQWSTHSESNNSHWNIYRAEIENYDSSYQVNGDPIQGEGTTSEQTNYSFTDTFASLPETTYWYWLESVDYSGESTLHGPANVTTPVFDNPEPPVITEMFGLLQNYPNPFNPSTMIQFRLEESQNAQLFIYDVKGRKVKTLYQGTVEAEKVNAYLWNGTDDNEKPVTSGIYFYVLVSPERTESNKMLLVK
jgi:hypothetical protein